jgi:hypothetical protein
MYKELASVKEIVDLSQREALDSAQALLTRHGYRTTERTEYYLTVVRTAPWSEHTLNLTVTAEAVPEGGVRIKVRGNDSEGVQERQAEWVEWSENLPKKTGEEPDEQTKGSKLVPVAPELAEPEIVSPEPQDDVKSSEAQPVGVGVIFDKEDQLQKIKAALLPDEQVEAVFDLKGGGTGFIGITSKRVIFQDNAWVTNTKAVVSIPYSRIYTVAAQDEAGLLTGRGFFSSSKVIITTSEGPRIFQFRGADKAHVAHDLILTHMI